MTHGGVHTLHKLTKLLNIIFPACQLQLLWQPVVLSSCIRPWAIQRQHPNLIVIPLSTACACAEMPPPVSLAQIQSVNLSQ